jgi:hypothetical protein
MEDLFYVAVAVIFFGITALFVRLCDTLASEKTGDRR